MNIKTPVNTSSNSEINTPTNTVSNTASKAKKSNTIFRESMRGLHTWIGLVPSWILYFMFITGSVGYFNSEITYWMEPEVPYFNEMASQAEMLTMAEQRLKKLAPNANEWYIGFPSERNNSFMISWEQALSEDEINNLNDEEKEAREQEINGEELLNPQTGLPLQYLDGAKAARDTGGGNDLYVMHYALKYLPDNVALYLVIFCTLFMLVAIITGIIIHKQIFKDFFTFRQGKKQRSWLDMHNISAVFTLPFQLMITYSGLLFFIGSLFPLLEFSPVAVVGFDLPNMVQSQGDTEKMSPKNKQVLDLVLKEVFNQDQPTVATGISVPTVPLNTLLTELKTHQPDQKISYITVDNFNDKNAEISIYINVENRVNNTIEAFTYQGVSGKLISSPSNKGFSATELKSTILNLHEGNFSPILLRWLYFFTGLMGAAMIATGSTLWVAKRRLKNEKKGNASRGFKFVELLNISTIVGLLIAIAAYFWANRLLPIELADRGDWEIDIMFIIWGLTFIYPMLRPLKRAWFELLYIAAAAYLLLPLINLFTTNRHLGNSIMQGDWVNASFDLTMILFGVVFVLAAKQAKQKQLAGSLSTSASSKPIIPRQATSRQPVNKAVNLDKPSTNMLDDEFADLIKVNAKKGITS
jgi:uncharacterized iron-regulated membrane protein